MSFNNWKEEDNHPLVHEVESITTAQIAEEEKRTSSPTESTKAKLDSLRDIVKSDLYRVMIKRAHSPDSARARKGAYFKKRGYPFPSLSKFIQEEESEDMTSQGSFIENMSPWKDDDSFALSDEDLDSVQIDEDLVFSDFGSGTEPLKKAWSTDPLDEFHEGTPKSKQQLLQMMDETSDYHDYHHYGCKSMGVRGEGKFLTVLRPLESGFL